uniref:alpha-N-acetylgalactosaminide alpha-2,6-sialyltransferase n=1 Tax=Chelydra serpentina TaxID=8475 RepID=A0A8C3T124_CHESE
MPGSRGSPRRPLIPQLQGARRGQPELPSVAAQTRGLLVVSSAGLELGSHNDPWATWGGVLSPGAGTTLPPLLVQHPPPLAAQPSRSPARLALGAPGAHRLGTLLCPTSPRPGLTAPPRFVVPVVRGALARLDASANGRMFEARPGAAAGGSPCIRCAVVGNGGILNGSRAGAAIDQHDYVFRTNGALTKGFERDVGRRTSFYVFSTNTMVNSLRNYASNGFHQLPQTLYIFLPDHDRDYLLLRAALTHRPVDSGPEEGARPERYFRGDLRAEKFKMFHPDFIRYVRNRFLRSRILDTPLWKLYRPSTGAVMLLAALHTCDEVSAYGFISPDYQAYSDHYFDRTRKALLFYCNHDLRLEMRLWQKLHQSRLITLYARG